MNLSPKPKPQTLNTVNSDKSTLNLHPYTLHFDRDSVLLVTVFEQVLCRIALDVQFWILVRVYVRVLTYLSQRCSFKCWLALCDVVVLRECMFGIFFRRNLTFNKCLKWNIGRKMNGITWQHGQIVFFAHVADMHSIG